MNTTRPPSWLQLRAQGLFSFTALPCPALRRRSAGSQAQTLFFHVFSSPSFFHFLFSHFRTSSDTRKTVYKTKYHNKSYIHGFFFKFLFLAFIFIRISFISYIRTGGGGVTKQLSKRRNSETGIYLYFYVFILVAVIFLSLLIEDCQSRL